MYLLVNQNFIIPKIKKYETLEESIKELQYDTIERTQEYNSKIFVINEKEQNIIYTSDNKNIYSVDINSSKDTQKILYTNEKMYHLGNEYWKEIDIFTKLDLTLESSLDKISEPILVSEKNSKSDMNVIFNEKKKVSNVKFKDENKESIELILKNDDKIDIINDENENENKENKIIKMIEDVNDLYVKELSKIKKLESNLKTFNIKLNNLEKNKKDKLINNIIRTQSEYRTWKKIKYGLKDNDNDILQPISELEVSNDTVPILFLSKYDYIERIQNNESIKKLLDNINKLDLNDLYSEDKLPDDNIIKFCNKYMKLSEELHYQFDDHEWSYLENEMNLNSTNKLSSNYNLLEK